MRHTMASPEHHEYVKYVDSLYNCLCAIEQAIGIREGAHWTNHIRQMTLDAIAASKKSMLHATNCAKYLVECDCTHCSSVYDQYLRSTITSEMQPATVMPAMQLTKNTTR